MQITTRDGTFTFYESCKAGERSPDQQWAVDGAGTHRVFWAVGDPANRTMNDTSRYKAAKALLGYQFVKTEEVTSVATGAKGTRRWVQRELPHGYPGTFDFELNRGTRPTVYAQSISKCEAVSGKVIGVDGLDRTGGPFNRDGNAYYVSYRGLPYDLRRDDEVLAQSANQGANLLAAGGGSPGKWTSGGVELVARPDEGDLLGIGWAFTRYIVKTEEDATRQITITLGLLKYVTPNAKGERDQVPSGFPFTQTKVVVYYEWSLVPYAAIPRVAISKCLNKVNLTSFDGYEPNTLLFTGYRIALRRGPFGDFLANVVYRMSYMPNFDFELGGAVGWNSFPRVIAGKLRYDKANSTGLDGGTSPYSTSHFRTLFCPDQSMPA